MLASPLSAASKPKDIVLSHLMRSVPRLADGEELRLPTIRDLARRLGVGVSTVGLVYKQLAANGRIRTEVGNGSFLLPDSDGVKRHEMKVGIGLSKEDLSDPDGWYCRVYNGITMATLSSEVLITIAPINLQVTSRELFGQVENLDAVVLMPGRLLYQPLVEAATGRGIPCLYFNAPDDCETQNFVSPDYAGSSEVLGRAFRTAGRQNVLFLLGEAWHLSVSAHYQLRGLLTGLRYGVARDTRLQMDVAGGGSIECGRSAIRRILDERGQMPDGIYTTGDLLAIGCVEELAANGFSVPGDVSVAGGSGLELHRYSQPGLTRCAQPYGKIGHEIIIMLNQLNEIKTRSVPGKIIPMGWIGGATTSQAENEILMVGGDGANSPPSFD